MGDKTKNYWQQIRPLWLTEIKLWFGWTDWIKTVVNFAINFGGLWLVLFITDNLDNFIGSLAVELGKFTITIVFILFILTITYLRAANNLFEEQNKEVENLREIVEDLSPKNLSLFVEYGANINTDAGGGIPKTTLTVDVVNTGNRKILDLEAHFASIDQVTENMPDDWSATKAYLSYRKKRLAWENGNNVIDLKPGFPETKLKIAVLDCSVSQFRIIHEGVSALLKDLQENSLYMILIRFRGKEEGEDQEYKFFDCEVRFICLPSKCVLEHITENIDVQVIPEEMRRKITHLKIGI